MSTISWSGGTGRYNIAGNWSSVALPVSGDTAVVGSGGTVQIRAGDDPTLAGFQITFTLGDLQSFGASSDSNLSLANSALTGSLTLNANMVVSFNAGAGEIASPPPNSSTVMLAGLGIGGSVIFNGDINVGAGDALNIGVAANNAGEAGSFDNAGVLNINGSAAASSVNYAFAQIKLGNSSGNSTAGASAFYGAVNISYGLFYAKAPDSGGAFTLSNDSELAVIAGVQLASANVAFADATDHLLLGQVGASGASQYVANGLISGFQQGDSIGLLTNSTGSTPIVAAQYDVSTGALDFKDAAGDVLGHVTLVGDYSQWSFAVNDLGSSPVSGYSDEYMVAGAPPCFCAGVLIETERGPVAVEQLRIGDRAIVAGGGRAPILWIGRRVASRAFGDPLTCWPIRIMAGALGDRLPARDLLLAPDHALLIDNCLVNAGALVDGATIMREKPAAPEFVYYHLELERHEVIFAENCPVESFVDNIERRRFDNFAEYEALYPAGRAIAEMAFPRVKSRRQLPGALLRKLERRAAQRKLAALSAA